jgi:hypothetical protein
MPYYLLKTRGRKAWSVIAGFFLAPIAATLAGLGAGSLLAG